MSFSPPKGAKKEEKTMKSRRRKKWLFIILGILAVLAIVLAFVLVVSGSNQANPALLYKSDRNSGTVAWSPDGRYIASAGQENTAQIWEALTGKLLVNYTGHSAGVTVAVWSPDGKYIASASFPDGIANVWDAMTGQRLLTFREQASTTGHENISLSVAWSPDGKEIASADDRSLMIWNAKTGITRLTIRGIRESQVATGVNSVAWSPDGKKIATANGTTVQIRNAATGAVSLTYTGPDLAGSVAWSPDGKYLASAIGHNTVHVWDAGSGATLLTYRGHTDQVMSVAWSPDGKKIASGSSDGTVQVWDPLTGKRYVTYTPPRFFFLNIVLPDFITSVAWSPDGTYLASATGSSVQIWKAP